MTSPEFAPIPETFPQTERLVTIVQDISRKYGGDGRHVIDERFQTSFRADVQTARGVHVVRAGVLDAGDFYTYRLTVHEGAFWWLYEVPCEPGAPQELRAYLYEADSGQARAVRIELDDAELEQHLDRIEELLDRYDEQQARLLQRIHEIAFLEKLFRSPSK